MQARCFAAQRGGVAADDDHGWRAGSGDLVDLSAGAVVGRVEDDRADLA